MSVMLDLKSYLIFKSSKKYQMDVKKLLKVAFATPWIFGNM